MRERKRTPATTKNKPSKSTRWTGPQAIPAEVRQAVVARLEPEQRRYVGAGVASGFDLTFKGPYLYVASRSAGPLGGRSHASPLCRLKYAGNADRWQLEMFRYRDHDYDTAQDFPNVSLGTPEECFGVAADFYLLESDPLQAGWSRNEPEELIPRHGEFEGQAMVLPPIREGQRPPVPERFSALPSVGDTPLVADFAAWMHWIRGRTVALGPRTLGLGRADLQEVNSRMRVPQKLHPRIVQHGVPRVQCCFHVAEALGLLDVSRASHRASGTAEIDTFLELAPERQWWTLLEAMWQRVTWSKLRPDAYGQTDGYQAGRHWLALDFSRRSIPLVVETTLVWQAEVLERYLLPFWADADLLQLSYELVEEARRRNGPRATGLSKVSVTELGRAVFTVLADGSPRDFRDPLAADSDEDLCEAAEPSRECASDRDLLGYVLSRAPLFL